MTRVGVLFPLPLPEPFDYAVPDGLALAPGDHVEAPLGPRRVQGVVWRVEPADAGNLKSVLRRIDAPPLPPETLAFVNWTARYCVQPLGATLALVLRAPDALQPGPTLRRLVRGAGAAKETPARTAVLAALEAAGAPLPAADLARAAGVTPGVVAGLVKAGVLAEIAEPADPPFAAPDLSPRARPLSDGQAAAVAELARIGAARPILIDGVTGSGKTEVYLEALAAALQADETAQVLVLLPEIALTQAFVARLMDRFGAEPAQWHSEAGPAARRRVWREVAHGRARIIVGARSALFLPFRNLKAVVVDEEHDGSYKQDEGFRYHARDLAVVRARLSGAQVILASATPSLETLANTEAGRYDRVRLPSRFGAAVLPKIELIDLRAEPPERERWLSPALVRAMAETLGRREQTLLFLNRRGYAPLVLCRACGHRMKAPDTESWLVEHRYTGRLVCHLTGFSMPKPKACPACGTEHSLVSIGPGVERVTEEARERFPQARIEVLSSDLVAGPAELRALIGRMERGEIDILVGTQIVAKGHNFPNLTLVGVVDADMGLKGGDLRAGERTFQLLAQVAGRAGRADRPGRALIQTYAPDHPALQALAAGDRDAFLASEQADRTALGMPPYGRLAALHLLDRDPTRLGLAAQAFAEAAPAGEDVEVWGPAPPPLGVVRGWRRMRFLVRSGRGVDLSAYLRAWLDAAAAPKATRVIVDMEPYSFL